MIYNFNDSYFNQVLKKNDIPTTVKYTTIVYFLREKLKII